jgi:hypothetical protein
MKRKRKGRKYLEITKGKAEGVGTELGGGGDSHRTRKGKIPVKHMNVLEFWNKIEKCTLRCL